jgi:ATP-binding cassette subfamily F protein 3
MSILTATNLYKAYDPQEIFWDVNVAIAHGEKIAMVGPNGAGKTTLLRILIGLEEPTEGRVTRMGNIRIGYLPQDADQGASMVQQTPWQLCCDVYADLIEMQGRLRRLEAQLADPDEGEAALGRYGRLLETFEHAGGYSYEVDVRTVLSGLGIDEEHMQRPLAQLSGGQRTRALLARLLLEKPNILVLDEPTNHLDLAATEWLEGYLQAWPEAVLVVSHDRYFMDRVALKIWDLAFGQVEVYNGNYSHYVQQRAERWARRQAEWKAQQAVIAKTEEFVRRFKAGQRSKEARGRETRLKRMERLERPRQGHTIHLRLHGDQRSGELVLRTYDLVVGHDRPLVTVPDLELRRLQRAALIGPNGSGKTTFLKTALGEMPPLSGRVRLGASLRIGYLAQTREDLDLSKRVIDEVTSVKDLPDGQMRDLLARYLFTGDDVFKQISDLSGGEQCRVALAKLTLSEPNFLVLDEPTNQLDIPSQEIMEQVLRDFVGTVLFVSHDRYLIDALATQIWVIEGDQLRLYVGNYQEYLAQRQKEQEAARRLAEARQAQAAAALEEQARRGAAQRRANQLDEAQAMRTLLDVEEDISHREKALQELAEALARASVESDLDRVRALGVEYAQVEADLEHLLAEWTALGEADG